jgi:hypothetical protein
MSAFELLAAVYFIAFGIASLAAPRPWTRRALVGLLSLLTAAGVIAVAEHGEPVVRAWIPHAYLVAGYWMPGLLVGEVTGATRFETWLATQDRKLRPRLPTAPSPLAHVAESAYLLCYPLVTATFFVVWRVGDFADVTRFWVAVLLAGYACYATLPWLVSRPPRLVGEPARARYVAAVNVFVLGRVSHRLNTFPSGHVAVSLASAGALWVVSPPASVAVGAAAVGVAIGAAAGRYHYVTDVWAGALAAASAVAIAVAAV